MDRRLALFLLAGALATGAAAFFVLTHEDDGARAATPPEAASEAPAAARGVRDEGPARTESQGTGVASLSSATITGRVVDSTGKALDGARLLLGEQVVRTDRSGRFVRVPVPDTRAFEEIVVAASEWHTPVVYSLAERPASGARRLALRAGENVLGDVRLAVSGAVSGEVLDDRGVAVEGALVSAGPSRAAALSARTDVHGLFRLGSVPPGDVSLTVRLGDRTSTQERVHVVARKETAAGSIVLPRGVADRTIRGKVIAADTGEAVAGVVVRVGAGSGAKAGISGGDGRFEIRDVPDMNAPVTLRAEGHGWPATTAGPFHPADPGIAVVLQGGAFFEIRVTDASSGAPIEQFGAWTCSPLERGEDDEKPPVMARPGGVARLRASAPLRTRLVVDAPGYLLLETHVEPGRKALEVRLARGSPVKVRVTRAGRPVPNVDVEIVHAKPPGGGLLGALVRDVNVAAGATQTFVVGQDGSDQGTITPETRGRAADRTRRTGPGGAVEFTAVPAGEHIAIVRDAAGAESRSSPFRVEGGVPAQVDVIYAAPGTLRGVVQGIPASGLRGSVALRRDEGDDPTFRGHGAIDPVGAFEIAGLRPGRYRAALRFDSDSSGPDFDGPASQEVTILDSQTTETILDASREDRGTVEGRIVWSGTPASGVTIGWLRNTPAPPRRSSDEPLGADGGFRFSWVPSGSIELEVRQGQLVLATLGPAALRRGEVARLSTDVPLGTLRLDLGPRGAEPVLLSIAMPKPGRGGTLTVSAPGEVVVPCVAGDVSAQLFIGGKTRNARGLVTAGAETFLRLEEAR